MNPHIRNKQALDMDIVLICAKKSDSPPLSHHPQDILERVIKKLDAGMLTSSDNKLFLHFMGELLTTASSVHEKQEISYEWFAQALAHFDEFLLTRKPTNQENVYHAPSQLQLRLLETAIPE